MKGKILVYDRSLGYGIYFEKTLNKEFEIKSTGKNIFQKKIDLFYFDNIIFIINEMEDVQMFMKIYSANKGINLFLGITQNRFKEHFLEINDIHFIDLELSKTDIVKFINKKIKLHHLI